MFVHRPAVVWSGLVNEPDPIVYPVEDFDSDGTISGDFGNIKPGMTIMLGTAPGLGDLGRTFVRFAVEINGTLHVGRTPRGRTDGQIDLIDNSYITVLDDYRVWAKIPWVNRVLGIWLKDGYIGVGNNVAFPPPKANGGAPVVGTISAGVLTTVLSGENSFDFSVDTAMTLPSAFLWDVKDGSIIGGLPTDVDITVQFPPGFRWVDLTVSSYSGLKSHTHHIPVFARDPADDESFSNFTITSHSVQQGGSSMTVELHDDMPIGEYYDGSMVLVFDGDASGLTDRNNILFYGWMNTEDNSFSGEERGLDKKTTIELVDVCGRLKQLPSFSQSQEYVATPTLWTHTKVPHMMYYIWYLLHWHSTALDVADLLWTSPYSMISLEFKNLTSDAMDLYNQVHSMANAMTPDHYFNCSKNGQMVIAFDPFYFLELSEDLAPPVLWGTFSEGDITSLDFSYNPTPRVGRLVTGAMIGDRYGETAQFTQVPGDDISWGQGAQEMNIDGRKAWNTFGLYGCEGHRFARMNAPFGMFTIGLKYNSATKEIDPARLGWYVLSLAGFDLPYRDREFYFEKGVVHQVDYNYRNDPAGTTIQITIQWEMEVQGFPGVFYELPED